MNSISSGDSSPFSTTRWSIVTHAVPRAGLAPRDALAELCLGYWFAIYAYIRRSGYAPTLARDITRGFLGHLLNLFRDGEQPLPTGHFRRFLLDRLDAFLRGDWREAPAPPTVEPALPETDVEARYERDCAAAASPEQAFQRGFALEVLARALRRLGIEAQQTDHADMYRALLPFLSRDPAPGESDDLARALRTRPLAIVVALKRLRQRFRELAGEELADTVSAPDELAAEQDALHAILHGNGRTQ